MPDGLMHKTILLIVEVKYNEKIFIVGGNGFARECYSNLINLKGSGKENLFKEGIVYE